MIFLEVPFSEKEEAKRLGAKWHAEQKKWYVPVGLPKDAFEKWFKPENTPPQDAPLDSNPNIVLIAPVYIVSSFDMCWKCREWTAVHCVGSTAVVDRTEDAFVGGPQLVLVSDLMPVTSALTDAILRETSVYSEDYSKTQKRKVFMNHCLHCGAKLGDFYMHNEPGGAFCKEAEEMRELGLTKIFDSGRYLCHGSFRYPYW